MVDHDDKTKRPGDVHAIELALREHGAGVPITATCSHCGGLLAVDDVVEVGSLWIRCPCTRTSRRVRRDRRWGDAAKILGRDPTAKVKCPACDHEYLTVRDVFAAPGSEMFERYLECPSCGRRNIMRMRVPAPQEPSDT